MEPCKVSPNGLAAERWLDDDGSFSSVAVALAENANAGFTRRCGKRDPVDKSPCLLAYGHEGLHDWEPIYTPSTGANGSPALAGTASFSSDRIGDGAEVLTLNGKCDLSTALLVEQRIASALAGGATEIIIDLRGVTSIGRSMLQVLFRALIRMGRNGRLVLVRPNAHVWARFEESGLDKGFSTFLDLQGALAEVFARDPEDLSSAGLPSPGDLSGTR
jgi:anti-anti-sigma factor